MMSVIFQTHAPSVCSTGSPDRRKQRLFSLPLPRTSLMALSKGREAKSILFKSAARSSVMLLARVDVDEVANKHIVAFGIGIDDLFAANDNFINAFNRCFH